MTSQDHTVEQRDLVDERLGALLGSYPPASTSFEIFRGAQYDLGLAWVDAPEGEGGLGIQPALQDYVEARLQASGAETDVYWRNGIGLTLVSAALFAFGTAEQRARHLRPIFTCEEIWCQLFSEPGAGSDLAALSTRAVRRADGDWLVSGQKVWTTLGHVARFGLLLARTDPDLPKHRGITCFILDMQQPTVDVRALRDILGEIEFNEVFIDDALVSDKNRIGERGQGWRVAQTTLSSERSSSFLMAGVRESGAIATPLALWRDGGRRRSALSDRLIKLWIDAEVLRLMGLRLADDSGEDPAFSGIAGKILFAEHVQEVYDFCLTLKGSGGLIYDGYGPAERTNIGTLTGPDAGRMFLRSQALSIEGGTSEVLRNVVGERVLGLAPEPRSDKDRPWSEVPRD